MMKKKSVLYNFLFALYLAVLVYFLFFADGFRGHTTNDYRYNFVPFHEIMRFIKYAGTIGFPMVAINLAGNIVAFMPLGFFVPHLSKRPLPFWAMTLLAFDCSVLVEVIQLFTKVGCCDVDDVILNTVGGALGYLCFVLTQKKNKRKGRKR